MSAAAAPLCLAADGGSALLRPDQPRRLPAALLPLRRRQTAAQEQLNSHYSYRLATSHTCSLFLLCFISGSAVCEWRNHVDIPYSGECVCSRAVRCKRAQRLHLLLASSMNVSPQTRVGEPQEKRAGLPQDQKNVYLQTK